MGLCLQSLHELPTFRTLRIFERERSVLVSFQRHISGELMLVHLNRLILVTGESDRDNVYHGIKGERGEIKKKTFAWSEGFLASWEWIQTNLRPRSGCIIMCIMPKAEDR